MGGPCTLQSGATAPACTDNFYVACFSFGGKEWQSCEQCFQACKSLDFESEYSEAMRRIQKQPGQSDYEHGMACWSASRQLGREQMRSDWNAVRVDIMYRVNLAKYMANPGLQADLLSTGDEAIVHPDSDFWGTWNGVIQMRIREELRPEQERAAGLLQSLVSQMEDYKVTSGGEKFPIP